MIMEYPIWRPQDDLVSLQVIYSNLKGPDEPCDLFEDCLVVAPPVYDKIQELSGAELEAFIGTLKVRSFPFKALVFEPAQLKLPYFIVPSRWGEPPFLMKDHTK